MPMFDIEGSDYVELDGNETNREGIAKIRNSKVVIGKDNKAIVEQTQKMPAKEDIVELKPNFMGIGLNVNAIFRKFASDKK